MDTDFALICAECAAVTLFQSCGSYPRCCARCGLVLRQQPAIQREVPAAELAVRSHADPGARAGARARND
jgi:hypothetical protein